MKIVALGLYGGQRVKKGRRQTHGEWVCGSVLGRGVWGQAHTKLIGPSRKLERLCVEATPCLPEPPLLVSVGVRYQNVHFCLIRHTSHVLGVTTMLRNFLLLKKQVTTVLAGKSLNLILSKYLQALIGCSNVILDSIIQSKIRRSYLSRRP